MRALTGDRSVAGATGSRRFSPTGPPTMGPSRQRVASNTGTPRCRTTRSAVPSASCTVPLPVAATTRPCAPAAQSASTTALRAPAWLATMSTTGHSAASAPSTARPSAALSGHCRRQRNTPSSTHANGPASPELNASRRYGCALCTSCAPCTAPASTATTPRACGCCATRTASSRFCGPSAWALVAGRMAAVSTTGLRGASTRCRNHAVSSSVSVPWVMTIPVT